MAIATGTALALGAAATVAGGVMSSRAASGAARTQANSAAAATEAQQQAAQASIENQLSVLKSQERIADNTQKAQIRAQIQNLEQELGIARQTRDAQLGVYAPYAQAGQAGQNRLMEYLGIGGNKRADGYGDFATAEFTPEAFAAGQDPGYGFRMREGLKAVDAQAAARGGLISGAALKASQRFGQDMASQEYQNAFNRYQTTRTNTLSPYQQLQGVGMNAAQGQAGAYGGYGAAAGGAQGRYGQNVLNVQGNYGSALGSAYQNYGNQVTGALTGFGNASAANTMGAGNALAAGQVGQANAINQGISGISNMYYQNQMLNMLRPQNTYANSPYNDLQDPGGIGY